MAEGNDKMVKNVRKSLSDIAKHGSKYFTGTAKLFLASTTELVNRDMPFIESMINTNQDILNDTLQFLRNPVDSINRGVNTAMGSKNAKAISKLGKNMLDDLKSGELYKKDRLRSGFNEGTEGLLDNFGDFDMSAFDAGGDYDDNDSAFGKDFEAQMKIAEMQEDGEATRTEATIDAIGDATEVIVTNQNANAQTNIRLALKQHAQLMSGMQNVVTQQAATLQAVNQTATSILDVTREAHKQIMDNMNNMTKLLTEIRDNTAPIKPEEDRRREPDEIIGVNGELNIRNYIKQVKKNIDETFNISGMLGAAGMTDLPSMLEMIGDNPWQLISNYILDKLIPGHTKDAIKRTGSNLTNFFPALLTKFTSDGKRAADNDSSSFLDLIKPFLGVEQRSKSSIDTKMKDPGAQAILTNRTTMAIEQVMPMWLSKIYSAISGDPLSIYDYKSGHYKTVASVISDTTHSARDLVGRMGIAQSELKSRLDRYEFSDPSDREDFMNYYYRLMQKMAETSTFLNPYMNEQQFKELMPESFNKDFYYNLLMGAMKTMSGPDLLALSSEIMGARESRNRANAYIHENLRDSGTTIAMANGVINNRLNRAIRSKTIQERLGLRGDDLDTVMETQDRLRVKAGGNKNMATVMNETLSLLKRGIITYTYILGGSVTATDGNEAPEDTGILDAIGNPIVRQVQQSRANPDTNMGSLTQIINILKKDAEDEQAHIDKLAQIVRDERERKDAYRERARERMAEKRKNTNRGLDRLIIDSTMEGDIFEDQQRAVDMLNLPKGETTGNTKTDRLNAIFQNKSKGIMKSVDAMMTRAGLPGIMKNIGDLSDEPFNLVTNGLRTVDAFLFRLLYGMDAGDAVFEDSKIPSLMLSLEHNMRLHWLDARKWFTDNIGDPLKNALLGENGIIGKIADRLREKVVNPIKNNVGSVANTVREHVFGVRDVDEEGNKGAWKGGLLSGRLNDISQFADEKKRGTKTRIGKYIDQKLWGDAEGKTQRGKVRIDESADDDMLTDYGGYGISNRFHYEYRGIMGGLRKTFDRFNEMLFGADENGDDHGSKEKFKVVKDEFKKAFPDVALGAGAGVIGSLFLPGGPILGALLGSVGGFVTSSEKFKTALFGESVDDTQEYYDTKTGEMKTRTVKSRKGGIISKTVYDGVKKFAPKMGIGALLGAAAGGVGLLPFGLGPIIGGVLGSIGGMTAASDQLKKIIFGDASKVDADGNPIGDTDGLISRKTRESIKKAMPAGIAGALGGAGAWGLISNVGLIPGLALLPGGPILGLLGGLTAVVNHDKIEKYFFGEEQDVEETDPKTGKIKTVKKKVGGLFGKAYDYTNEHVFKPFGEKINKAGESVQNWFKQSVVSPLENGMSGMREQFERGKNAVKDVFTGIGDHVFKTIDNSFENIIGMPLKQFMDTKIFKPLNNLTDKIFSTIGKAIGNILSAPFKAIEFIFNGTIEGKTMDERREERRENRRTKRREARQKRHEARRLRNLTVFEHTRMKLDKLLGIPFGSDSEIAAKNNDQEEKKEPKTRVGKFIAEQKQKRADKKAQRETQNQINDMWEQYEQQNSASGDTAAPPSKTANPKKKKTFKEQVQEMHDARQKKKEEKAKEKQEAKDKKEKEKTEIREKIKEEAEKKAQKDADKAAEKEMDKEKAKASEDKGLTSGPFSRKNSRDYLKDIAKSTKNIYNEIKGQLGGSGWNIAYIKTLLEQQFGRTLSSDDLPEEMEGSSKAVKKKRGFLGKVADKAKDVKDSFTERVSGVGTWLKEKVGGIIDIVVTPFRLLGSAAGFVKDSFLTVGSVVGKIIGGIWNGLKELGSTVKGFFKGLFDGIGKLVAGAAGVIKEGMIGVASVLKEGAVTFAKVIGNGIGIFSDVIRAGSEIITDVIPDLFSMGWDFFRAVGRGGKKLVKGGFRLAGKTIKGFGRKLFGPKLDENGNPIEEEVTKYLGTVKVEGGYLDDVPVTVGGASIPFPYLTVMNGRAIGKHSNHAIPVYVLGFDPRAKYNGRINTDAVNSDEDESADNTNKVGSNLQGVTPPEGSAGDIVTSDTSTDGAESTTDNTSAETPKKKSKLEGVKDKFRAIKQKYFKIDRDAENSQSPGDAYDKAMRLAEDMDDIEAIRVVQQLNMAKNGGEGSGKKDEEKAGGGLLDKILGFLGGEGGGTIGKIVSLMAGSGGVVGALGKFLGKAGGGISTGAGSLTKTALGNLPFLAGTIGAATSGDYARVGTNVARQTTSKILPWLSKSATGYMMQAGETAAASSSFGTKLISGFSNALSKLAGNKTIVNALNAINKSGKLSGAFTKVTKAIESKFSDAVLALGGEGVQQLFKKANWVVLIATAVWDFTSGGYKAAEYFNVSSSAVTAGMRFAAGFAKAVSGLAFGLIPVEWLANTIWGFFAPEEEKAQLKEDQAELNAATRAYNSANGTNLSTEEYNKQFKLDGTKKGFWDKAGEVGKSIGSVVMAPITIGQSIVDKLVGGLGHVLGGVGNFFKKFLNSGGTDSPKVSSDMQSYINMVNSQSGAAYGYGTGPSPETTMENTASQMLAGRTPEEIMQMFKAIGAGLAGSMMKSASKTLRTNRVAVKLFGSMGEGLGGSLLDDMKETDGKNASIASVISNTTAAAMLGASQERPGILGTIGNGIKAAGDKVGEIWNNVKTTVSDWWYGKGGASKAIEDLTSDWGTGPVTGFNQKSGKWNKGSSNIAKVGCGPTAAAMVASAYGDKSANPAEANRMSYGMGMRASDGGTNPAFFSKYGSAHGFGMNEGPVSSKAIGSNLRNGQPVVMMGKGGPFGGNMHYLVADGMSGKGSVNLMDPLTGSHRSASMGTLTKNSKTALYSFGKGPADQDTTGDSQVVETDSGTVNTTDAQNALVNKMASIIGKIKYSTGGTQNPDKGTASCASTVGWAYNKVLGVSGMSASSSDQSKDSRFTTIYVKKNANDQVPLDILQPGDIMYQKMSRSGDRYGALTYNDLVAENPQKPLGHTEMYAGDGRDLSHGGSPAMGPVYKDLNEYRRSRTFMVRRYTPFVNGDDLKLAEENATTNTSSAGGNLATAAATTAGAVASGATSDGTVSGIGGLLSGISSMIQQKNSWLDNMLNAFLGGEVDTSAFQATDAPNTKSTGGKTEETQQTTAHSKTVDPTSDNSIASLAGRTMVVLGDDKTSDPAQIWSFFRSKGLSPIATAGILGNLEAESGVRANNLQDYHNKKFGLSDDEYTAKVDDGSYSNFVNDSAGYGVAQWTFSSRKKKLYDAAKSTRASIGDPTLQANVLWDELNEGYRDSTLRPLMGATTVKDASTIFLQNFERPKTKDSQATIDLRANMAQNWYDKFAPREAQNVETRANDSNAEEFGTGPVTVTPPAISGDATRNSLMSQVQNLNKMMQDVRDEASKQSTVAEVTDRITNAIGLDTSKNDPQTKLMETIANSLAVMVEHLAAIRENTQVKEKSKVETAREASDKKNHMLPGKPQYPNTSSDPDDVGAIVIDRLTSR